MPVDQNKIAVRSTTQEHLEVEDVRDDIIILKDGGCAIVLATTAINFGLLSEKEQDATIFTYAGLLNSLAFPIQLIIRSKKKDVSGYLKLLDKAEAKETGVKIREQIRKYKNFIKEIVAKNEVLDKKFYLIIPMTSLELGVGKAITGSFTRKKKLPYSKDFILEKAKTKLYPKKDHLIKQLSRLGLRARQLTTQELIQLLFDIYNPSESRQPLSVASDYQSPVVQTVNKINPPIPKIDSPVPPKENLEEEINHLVKKASQE